MFYQVQSQHRHLPGDFRAASAEEVMLPSFMELKAWNQALLVLWTKHLSTVPKLPIISLLIILLDWLANLSEEEDEIFIHYFQGSVLGFLCSSSLPGLLVRTYPHTAFHTIVIQMTRNSLFSFLPQTLRFSPGSQVVSSWQAAHQLKLNLRKTELLIVSGDSFPCQDLKISLDNN